MANMMRLVCCIHKALGPGKSAVATAAALRAGWAKLMPHAPLINFRYGKGRKAKGKGAPNEGIKEEELLILRSVPDPKVSAAQKPSTVSASAVWEESQLPERWKRKPVSDKEIEVINRGGFDF